MVKISELKNKIVPRKALDELPDEFQGVVLNVREGEDNYGAPCLYIDIYTSDGYMITQKFREQQIYHALIPALEEMGIEDTDELMHEKFTWKKVITQFAGKELNNGNTTYPRWIPVKNGSKRKKKGQ